MQAARRHRLGQWFTPAPVVELALALAELAPGARVLDPACGDGAFLLCARAAGLPPGQLAGIDVDPRALHACRERLPGAELRLMNLFEVAPPSQGFDAVVGNPPYVRQERMTAAQKRAVRARLIADWPELGAPQLERLLGRGDLSAAFLLRSLRMLRPGGRLSFVVSSALLDAGYAAELWSLVNQIARPLAVVDAPAERWFAEAAVNTIIIVLERGTTVRPPPLVVARLHESTAEAAQRVRCVADLANVAELRHADPGAPDSWSAAVRAPQVWFDLQRAAASALVPLSTLADVRRGMTSGANSFFYLSREVARAHALEPSLLVPLVRSPRQRGATTICVDPADTSHVALVCPSNLTGLPGAARYVAAHRALARRPTLRARPAWWVLPAHPARLFLTKAYAARFVQRFSPVPIVADQRVYAIHPHPGVDVELLAAILNSTFTALALESLGRASMGEGALEWTVADAAQLPVLDPRRLSSAAATRVRRCFERLSVRPIGDVHDEATRPDRRAMDAALASGLSIDLDAIHAGLMAAVQRRCSRSARYLSV